ncbi:MAG TPA: AAA family ATPase [Polyangia bacterium]|nr:AAA family ATPase [Polyangia bacterium]
MKRFRSAPAASIDLDNPVFLVGRNGAGKTNVVDAFAFLAECMAAPLQAVFDNRGGISAVRNRTPGGGYPPNLGIRIDLGTINGSVAGGHYAFEVRALPEYGFEVVREQCRLALGGNTAAWFDRKGDLFRSNEESLRPAIDAQSLALPAVGGTADFAPLVKAIAAMRKYSIDPTAIREMQDPDSGLSLKPDGSNVASVLERLLRHSKNDATWICEMLEAIVPGTKEVKPIKHGKKLSLKFRQLWAPEKSIDFEAFAMSDGTLRALGLLAAVAQKPSPSLLCIEEPESTIHPGALGAILDVLKTASERFQVVITTHSPELLDADWIEDRHLRVVTWESGATHVAPLGDAARSALKDHVMGAGELLRSNVLDSGPLFDQNAAQGRLFEDAPT